MVVRECACALACIAPMSCLGRSDPLIRGDPNGRNRRISPVAVHSSDRLLSEPTAGTQPWWREPLLMPHTCRLQQHPSVPAQLGADASGCGRKNRTFASFGEYDPLCSIDDGVFEIRSRPIGSGCSGQTSKSRYVTPGPAATRWFPIVAHWIHAIIAPSITSVARRCERVVVRHLHQLVQLPSPNAHVPAIEQR